MSESPFQPPQVKHAGTDVSVIVPFYNAEKHVEECIKALLAQSYPASRYEIIMVDNNSTDGSAAIVGKYSRITLLRERKQGAYAARNRGVAASTGPIIAFTDADCAASPDWLEQIVAAMHSPEVRLVQGGRSYGLESPGLTMLETYESERAVFTFSGSDHKTYYGYTNNMAVRRDVFDRCGPFLEVMRGADSVFVHSVIAEYSSEAARYAPAARIRHLEITSVKQWLQKRFVYGRSFQQNYQKRKGAYRLITPAESSVILRKTIRQRSYSPARTLCLITLLWMGTVFYLLGRIAGRAKTANQGEESRVMDRGQY
jgi:glycosyltransferase involved in cell wall biosynthesis